MMNKPVLTGVLVLATLFGLTSGAGALSLSILNPSQVTSKTSQPVIQVQAADPALQIQQLEETIRTLTGNVEDMKFQLLQMQEQMRKTQEDNEFRFQELEKGKGTGKQGALEKPASDQTTDQASATPDNSIDTAIAEPNTDAASTADPSVGQLGAIKLDANGNPIGATAATKPSAASQKTASLDNPDDAYQAAYGHVLSGDYKLAEKEFRDYLDIYPKSEKAADANFWLGESQYSLGKYNDAAKTFVAAHKSFPNAPKAPEILLKLGMSLSALDNKDMACATLREVGKQYPKASKAVKGKVASEMSRMAC